MMLWPRKPSFELLSPCCSCSASQENWHNEQCPYCCHPLCNETSNQNIAILLLLLEQLTNYSPTSLLRQHWENMKIFQIWNYEIEYGKNRTNIINSNYNDYYLLFIIRVILFLNKWRLECIPSHFIANLAIFCKILQ